MADHRKSDPAIAEAETRAECAMVVAAVSEILDYDMGQLKASGIDVVVRRALAAVWRKGNESAHERATLVDPVQPVRDSKEWDPNT